MAIGDTLRDLHLEDGCTGRLCPWQYIRTVTSWLGRVTCTKPLTFVGSCDRLRLRGSGSLGQYSLVSCHHNIIKIKGRRFEVSYGNY